MSDQPTIGERMVDALRGGDRRDVEVSADGVRARARVVGSGPYGCDLESLSVEREPRGDADRGARTAAVTEAIARRLDYLSEPLEPLEIDASSGRGQLRTRRDRVRHHEYYEVEVAGGDRVDLRRYRYERSSGERHLVSENHGHGVIRRLVDDLNEVLDRRAAPRQEE